MGQRTATLHLDLNDDECYQLLSQVGNSLSGWRLKEANRPRRRIIWKAPYQAVIAGTGYMPVTAEWSVGQNDTVDVTISAGKSSWADPTNIMGQTAKTLESAVRRRMASEAAKGDLAGRSTVVPERGKLNCPACGLVVPIGSAFCLFCGANIPTSLQTTAKAPAVERKTVAEWDVQDFEWRWAGVRPYCRISGQDSYTEAEARQEFWQQKQQQIMSELQTFLDAGWQTVGEVGPAAIELSTSRSVKRDALGWMFWGLLYIVTCGLFLIFDFLSWPCYAEPVRFTVQLRRPRQ